MIHNKISAINAVNQQLEKSVLNGFNTSYSSINKSRTVWWFNINPGKFESDVHLILSNGSSFIWVTIPTERYSKPARFFRIRKDKNLIDIEISAEKGIYYLRDVKSGGTGFNFKPLVKGVFN